MIILATIVFCSYFMLLGLLLFGYLRLPSFSSEVKPPSIPFTLVIPFRNEADKLPALLESIQGLDYPSELLEIIFVDDASEDASVAIINDTLSEANFTIQVIKNERSSVSPKKDAITKAVALAINPWIITTDADCLLPPLWLRYFDYYIEAFDPVLIAGPVAYLFENTTVGYYQEMDNLSLQFVTIGSFGLGRPLLCNGANLAYLKTAYKAVGGYTGNDHLASGDDIFLLEKMNHSYPGRTGYLKSDKAIVHTHAESLWGQAISQRIRWVSKTRQQKGWESKAVGSVVFITNILLMALPALIYFDWENRLNYLLLIFVKFGMDALVISISSHFMKKAFKPFSFFVNFFLYPFLTVFIVLKSLSGRYEWKGRSFKNQL